MNKVSKKVKESIGEEGFYFENHNGVMLIASESDNGYTITSHKGYMPAFHRSGYETLEQLCIAMRSIAPLTKWKLNKD